MHSFCLQYVQDDRCTNPRKHGVRALNEKNPNCSYQTNRNRIPRFNSVHKNKNAAPHRGQRSTCNDSSLTDPLSINCYQNLSTSCSSLSSISSSGSSSPPPPPTSPTQRTNPTPPPAWKKLPTSSDKTNTPIIEEKSSQPAFRICGADQQEWLLKDTMKISNAPSTGHVFKSYSNARPLKNRKYNFDSSSLFCSNEDEEQGNMTSKTSGNSVNVLAGKQVSYTGKEYSLFGSGQFGSSFLKSPVIQNVFWRSWLARTPKIQQIVFYCFSENLEKINA